MRRELSYRWWRLRNWAACHVIHYCHRCDKVFYIWQKCPHNKRWSPL